MSCFYEPFKIGLLVLLMIADNQYAQGLITAFFHERTEGIDLPVCRSVCHPVVIGGVGL